MEIIGRLTADAKANEVKNGRTVVNFSIAINDSYKTKGSEAVTKVITYVNCAYWINPGIVTLLTKGSLVELFGRISVNTWTNAEGEAKASLTFHVSSIKLHGKTKTVAESSPVTNVETVKEDLPF